MLRHCKANKCSDAGAGDLGVLATHETSPRFSLGGVGSSCPGLVPPQVQKAQVSTEIGVVSLTPETAGSVGV